jgi:glycosyltransferase involved in cell wall biosynthesis
MKILYLCSDPGIPVLGRKGASIHVREMVGALARAGHQIVLAAPVLNKSPWEKPAEVLSNVVHVRLSAGSHAAYQHVRNFTQHLGLDRALSGGFRRILHHQELEDELIARFDQDPPDFIYERAALYGTAGAAVAEALGIPLVVELNAPLALEQDAYRGQGLGDLGAQAERWTLTQADAILAVSDAVRSHALSLGVDPAKVQVVPNGVNADLFHPAPPDPAWRARLALGEGPVLGFVGGLRPWHGIESLPDILARVSAKHPGARLVVVGDGPLRETLLGQLKERGLRDRAILTGALAHEDVPAVIRHFDIALAPYPVLDHAFYFSPLKVFEYMACGVAVVAANSGQIAEVIRDGETGLLHAPGDLDALAGACDRLLASAKLRLSVGQCAAAHIRAHYTWAHNARRVTDLAGELARRRNSRRNG